MKLPKSILSVALFLVALSSLPAHAVLKEARSMSEIIPTLGPDTLLLLDLDNTVIEAVQELGSDQWFDHVVRAYTDAGVEPSEAKTRAMSDWKRVNAVSAVRPVETITPGLIDGAQRRHVAVMGLTARPSDFSSQTRAQLASVGVDLSKTAPAAGSFGFGEGLKLDRGVVFVTGQDKGVAILKFLARIGYTPSRVVFVDDKLHNVQDVERALDGTAIEHVSYRYGAADEEVRGYDPALAEIQERFFGRILDDAAATRLLKAQP